MQTPMKKVARDFRGQKLRTVIVVVSIMVGVFCITAVGTISTVITSSFTSAFSTANVADITVVTAPTSDAVLSKISSIPNVKNAEARTVYQTRWRLHTTWYTMQVIGIDSFASMRVAKVTIKSGRYPGSGQIMPEYTSLQVLPTKVGQTVQVHATRGISSYTISGYGLNPGDPPAFVSGVSESFMPRAEVTRLSGITGANQFLVTIRTFKQKDATVNAVRSALQGQHARIFRLNVRDPNHFEVLDVFKSLTELLTIFGVIALVLSGMLVINTLSTVVSEQTPQIGTMKAVGANAAQVTRIYLTLGFLYGVCGTILGLILGVLGGYALVKQFAGQSGQQVPGISVAPTTVFEGILIGLGVTLVASFLPVWAGSRITVREAISSYGIGTGYKPSVVDRLVGTLRFLPRPARMSVRNTFRRRMRLTLTLVPLTMAGAAFLVATSLASGLTKAVDQVSSVNRADVVVSLNQPGPVARVKPTIGKVNGVASVEAWYQVPATIAGKQNIILSGVAANTRAYHISLANGRWVNASETHAVVLGDAFARDNGLSVGQTITVQAPNGITKQWQVVGTVNDQNNSGSLAFAPLSEVQNLMRAPSSTNYLLVVGRQHAHDALTGVIDRMGDALFPLGVQPAFTRVADLNDQVKKQFTILTVLFYTMVTIIAIVGALGLFAVLTMNVVERRKEIGVMRSIGASSMDVIQIFTVEGLAIGLIAFVVAVLIGIPTAVVSTSLVSKVLIQMSFSFSVLYLILMLAFMVVVAAISSIVPAASAAKLRIADVLRYG